MFWTEENTELLRKLWVQRKPMLSPREIAQRLDTTRNAILGKIHRLGLNNRDPSKSHYVPRKHSKIRVPKKDARGFVR